MSTVVKDFESASSLGVTLRFSPMMAQLFVPSDVVVFAEDCASVFLLILFLASAEAFPQRETVSF